MTEHRRPTYEQALARAITAADAAQQLAAELGAPEHVTAYAMVSLAWSGICDQLAVAPDGDPGQAGQVGRVLRMRRWAGP